MNRARSPSPTQGRRASWPRSPAALLLALVLAAGPAVAGTSSPADSIRARVSHLRARGQYREALAAVRQLSRLERENGRTPRYDLQRTEVLLRFVQEAAGLPASAQRELARADSLDAPVDSLVQAGNLAAAERAANSQLALREHVLGSEHPTVAATLANLTWITEELGRYDAALALCRRAIRVLERTYGRDHPDVATSLGDEALILSDKGDYAGAGALYPEVLRIFRRTLGPEDRQVAETLNDFAACLLSAGRFRDAERYNREALALRRKILAPGDAAIAQSLNNLAYTMRREGDYASAEALYGQAIAIWRQTLPPDHPDVANAFNNLAVLYQYQGDDAAAEDLYRRALTQDRKALGETHPLIASTLTNLAETLRREGKLEQAEDLIRQALAMHRRLLGEEHFMVASDLEALAEVLHERGELPEAERVMRQALELQARVQGPDHPELAATMQALGRILADRGDLGGAESAYRQALAIQRTHYEADHPAVVEGLVDLGVLLRQEGKLAPAESLLAVAAGRFESARVRAGSGVARATFLESPYPYLAACRLARGRTQQAWQDQEEAHGRVLDDLLLAAGREPSAPADTARRQKPSPARAASAQGRAFPLARVQRSLPTGSALIGWLDLPAKHGPADSWAYLIRPDGPVVWAPCGRSRSDSASATSLSAGSAFRDQLASAGASSLGAPSKPEDLALARTLWQQRIRPLQADLVGIERLIVVPSAPMLGVPLEALVDDQGRYLGESYSVSYVPSATLFAWLAESDRARRAHPALPGSPGALLVGDPAVPDSVAAPAAVPAEVPTSVPTARVSGPAAARVAASPVPGDSTRPSDPWTDSSRSGQNPAAGLSRLPWSREEVAGIAGFFPGATVLLGREASEQKLDSLARSGELGRFRVLHFATHALVDDARPERSAIVLSTADLPDPLTSALEGEKVYDGLLTAREIIREWKLNADLVVLSACESALGRPVEGEGYIGLAHALLQVGARSVIVSLWNVNDRASSLLMQRFYQDWCAGGRGAARRTSKAEALREAKEWLRNYVDPQGHRPFANQFYWSPFILVGDPN